MDRAPDQQDDPVMVQLEELADQLGPTVGATAGRRLIEAGLWTW